MRLLRRKQVQLELFLQSRHEHRRAFVQLFGGHSLERHKESIRSNSTVFLLSLNDSIVQIQTLGMEKMEVDEVTRLRSTD